jgi:predicted nucleic acid-binding protein
LFIAILVPMVRPQIYLDTSVINFLLHDDAPEKKEATIDFFDNYIKTGVYDTYISLFVTQEILQTPDLVKRQKLLDIIENFMLMPVVISNMNEVEQLAAEILTEGILPPNKLLDALHIAVCVVHEIDYLVSWNYKHLANVNKERKVLALTYKLGYIRSIKIITPLELISDEN